MWTPSAPGKVIQAINRFDYERKGQLHAQSFQLKGDLCTTGSVCHNYAVS